MEVFAHLLGEKAQKLLFSQSLEISREVAALLAEPGAGLYFDWGPDSSRYLSHVDKRPPSPGPEEFLDLLRDNGNIWHIPEAIGKDAAQAEACTPN